MKTHTEKIRLTKAEDSFTDESNPSCSKLPNKNETQPSKVDALQESLCSQTLVAEDMKFVCELPEMCYATIDCHRLVSC